MKIDDVMSVKRFETSQQFNQATAEVYKKVMVAFDDIDPDDAEVDFHLDNITITFRDNIRFIINRQPPVHQLWLATKNRGYHFDYNHQTGKWISDHDGEEFYSLLTENVEQLIGRRIKF